MSDERAARLSDLQLEVAELFFAVPESVGFLLAGGGALIAHGLIARPTDDLDFFGHRPGGDVAAAGAALIAAVRDQGWAVDVVRSGPEFRRLRIARGAAGEPGADVVEEVYVDLALDSPPHGPAIVTVAGPALSPRELAVRKTLALFSRAEPRDFADVHALHREFDRGDLLRDAAAADGGFDVQVFVQMLRSHRRLRDDDFPPMGVGVDELRAYFDAWADELANSPQTGRT